MRVQKAGAATPATIFHDDVLAAPEEPLLPAAMVLAVFPPDAQC